MTILNNEEKLTALTSCSPNIVKFLSLLDNGSEIIRWDRLNKDGCVQKDGTYFRVHSSVRTAKQQIAEFKRGREDVRSDTKILLFPNEYCSATPATKYELLNRGKVSDSKEVSTNAWAGESYHNWGLAIDLVIRHFGDSPNLELSDGSMSLANYYKLVGLVDLAKSCGLSWGGDWESFQDVLHFEDMNYLIPPKEFHYDKNMNFQFLQRFSENKTSTQKTSKFTKFGLLGVLGAYVAYKIVRGK